MFTPVISIATHAGNPVNEDRAFSALLNLNPVGRVHLYAVIDGHGGLACAAFIHENLEAHFTAAFDRAFAESEGQRTQDSLFCGTLRETYRTLDEAFRSGPVPAVTTGACILTVCLCNDKIYTANVGDCRAILGTCSDHGEVCVCLWERGRSSIDASIHKGIDGEPQCRPGLPQRDRMRTGASPEQGPKSHPLDGEEARMCSTGRG